MSNISNFIYRYLFLGNIENLSLKNKIIIFVVSMSFITLLFSLLYVMSNYDVTSWVVGSGFYVLLLGSFYQFFFYDKLKKKYGFYSNVRMGVTYQWTSKGHSFLIPGLLVIVFTCGFIMDNLTLGSLLAFALVFPFLALFFRTNVFNDNSCILDDEIVFGYHPTYYGFVSLFIGLYGYYNVYRTLNLNLELSVLFFVMTVIFQILFLFPDKCNEVLFFDLRRKEGCIAFSIILIVLYFAISYLLNGEFIISLSLQSFIRIIFLLGIGTIFAILFKRQMDNKK